MPKLKTKSGAKKRFKVTASGRIKSGPAGKRHNMIKRTTKFIRNSRGFSVLDESDASIVRKYMPYARKKRRAKTASEKKEGKKDSATVQFPVRILNTLRQAN